MYTFSCDACGRIFEAVSAAAITCSGACRVRRHRERQAAAAVRATELLQRDAHPLLTA